MGSITVACYRPKAGKGDERLEMVYNHVPSLRAEGLASDREPIVMRCADGTIVEVFEWQSQEALEKAHSSKMVQGMWKEFGELCDYDTPSNLAEFQNMFGHFEAV